MEDHPVDDQSYEEMYAEDLREPEPTDGLQARIDQLRSSDAYRKASDPAHDDVVRAVNTLFERMYASSEGKQRFEVTPTKLSADADLKAVLKHPAYRDPRHPDHERAVKAAEMLYNRIFPEGEDLANADLDDVDPDQVIREVDPQASAQEKVLNELQEAWGPDYESRLEGARDVVRQIDQKCGYMLSDLLEESGLGDNRQVIEAFSNLARGTISRDPSPADAKRFIEALKKTDAYKSNRNRLHEALVQSMAELYRLAEQA
jgi:hypothetical protein